MLISTSLKRWVAEGPLRTSDTQWIGSGLSINGVTELEKKKKKKLARGLKALRTSEPAAPL